MRRVLGIDCGSVATGYGVIAMEGSSCRAIACGVIRPPARVSFPERLKQISDKLSELIQTYSPDVVAVEGIFYSVNPKSALLLGQVRGVALLAAAQAGLPVQEYSPLEIKSSVVGYGRAEKAQIQQMVKALLALDEAPPQDAADALAVALCHAHKSQTLLRLPTPPTNARTDARVRPPARA